MAKLLPLTGISGVRAFNVFHSVILGLKMVPIELEKGYHAFLDEMNSKTEDEKREYFRTGLNFVPLEESDIEAVIRFCEDANGIPLTKNSVRGMSSVDIINLMVEVFLEIAKLNVNLVTKDEKKN